MKLANKRIFYVVSAMGLGHVQRSLPIIRFFLNGGAHLTILSYGQALALLKLELGDVSGVEYLEFEDYPPLQRGRGVMHYLYYIKDILTIARHINKERNYCKKLHETDRFSLIFSDGRFGFVDSKVPSFLLCHQISFILPRWLRLFQPFSDFGQFILLRQFTKVIVPDFEDDKTNLSGKLSHNWVSRLIKPLYIGFLSTLEKEPGAIQKSINYLFMIGGFIKDERQHFFDWANKVLAKTDGRIVLVLGGAELNKSLYPSKKNIEIHDQTHGAERNALINSAQMLVGRTGYTTLMDCCALGLKAVLLPTRNMTEQEYLAAQITSWQHSVPADLPPMLGHGWAYLNGEALRYPIRSWSTERSIALLADYLKNIDDDSE